MARGPKIGPKVRDERAYSAAIRRDLLNPMRARTRLAITEAREDYEAIRRSLAQARADILSDPGMDLATRRSVRQALERTRDSHAQEFTRRMRRHIGVKVRLIEDAEFPLTARIEDNVRLVRTIPPRFFEGMAAGLERLATEAPFDQERVMALFSREFGSAGYNLRRITRDQTSKLVGQLNHHRQTQVGVTSYEWVTAGDERVRRSHIAKEGETFRWDDPPADTGHPGDDIMCRCIAVAVIPDPAPEPFLDQPSGDEVFADIRASSEQVTIVNADRQRLQPGSSSKPEIDPRDWTKTDRQLLYHGTGRQDWRPHAGTHFTDSINAADNYANAGVAQAGDEAWVHVLSVRPSTLNRSVELIPESLTDTDTASDIGAFLKNFPEARDKDLVTYRDAVLGGSSRDIQTWKPLLQETADEFEVVDSFRSGVYIVDDATGAAVKRFDHQVPDAEMDDFIAREFGFDEFGVSSGRKVHAVEWYEEGGVWAQDVAPSGTPAHMIASVRRRKIDVQNAEFRVLRRDGQRYSDDNPFRSMFEEYADRYGPVSDKYQVQAAKLRQWEVDQARMGAAEAERMGELAQDQKRLVEFEIEKRAAEREAVRAAEAKARADAQRRAREAEVAARREAEAEARKRAAQARREATERAIPEPVATPGRVMDPETGIMTDSPVYAKAKAVIEDRFVPQWKKDEWRKTADLIESLSADNPHAQEVAETALRWGVDDQSARAARDRALEWESRA